MIFGKNAKIIMKEKGVKQNELARKIGKSSSGISTALRDDGNPSEEMMTAIAEGLGMPLYKFFVGQDEETGITPVMVDEKKLLDIYQQLNSEGQQMLIRDAENILGSPSMRKDEFIAAME